MEPTRVLKDEITFSPTAASNGSYLYQGEPFDGVAYSLFRDGKPESEEEFREGLRWGLTREWYKSGVLAHEATFYRDVVHGTRTDWYQSGQMKEQEVCRFGIVLSRTRWAADGTITEQYELPADAPQRERLKLLEATFAHEADPTE